MNDDQLLRYSRHIMLPEMDVDGQEKLLRAKVVLLNLTAVFGGGILLDRGNTFRGANFSSYDGYTHYVLFDQFQLGYAASLAWVFFIVVMIVILVMFGTSKRWVYFPDREN